MESPPHLPKGTPEDPILAAGVVLWCLNTAQQPEFLLLRNSLHQSWGLAKGHVEANEPIIQAGLREVGEETGYLLTAADLLVDFADTSVYQPKPDLWKRVIYFLATQPVQPDDLMVSNEHDQFAWLPVDLALEKCHHPALKRTLRRASNRLAELHHGSHKPIL
jgi:8-oxo-dGTP pyrophosphatase MutT (NUDIX family)